MSVSSLMKLARAAMGNNPFRLRPTQSLELYVRPDGNDANTGFANTAAGAFKTIQKAVDFIVREIDLTFLAGANDFVRINVADGSYDEFVTLRPALNQRYYWNLRIRGNMAAPQNCRMVHNYGGFTCNGGMWLVEGFEIDMSAAGAFAYAHGILANPTNTGVAAHVYTSQINILGKAASNQTAMGAYNNGGMIKHMYSDSAGGDSTLKLGGHFANAMLAGDMPGAVIVIEPKTLTLVAGTNVGTMLSVGRQCTGSFYYEVLNGTATGKRYDIGVCGVIEGTGENENYIPGNAVGTKAAGAQYV